MLSNEVDPRAIHIAKTDPDDGCQSFACTKKSQIGTERKRRKSRLPSVTYTTQKVRDRS